MNLKPIFTALLMGALALPALADAPGSAIIKSTPGSPAQRATAAPTPSGASAIKKLDTVDLVALKFELSSTKSGAVQPGSAVEGGSPLNAMVTVRNQGNVASAPYTVKVKNATGVQFFTSPQQPPLAPGQQVQLIVPIIACASSFVAVVDCTPDACPPNNTSAPFSIKLYTACDFHAKSIALYKDGQPISSATAVYPGQKLEARITYSNVLSPGQGTFQFHVDLQSQDGQTVTSQKAITSSAQSGVERVDVLSFQAPPVAGEYTYRGFLNPPPNATDKNTSDNFTPWAGLSVVKAPPQAVKKVQP